MKEDRYSAFAVPGRYEGGNKEARRECGEIRDGSLTSL